MKELTTYITEKLKINKDSKLFNVKDALSKMDPSKYSYEEITLTIRRLMNNFEDNLYDVNKIKTDWATQENFVKKIKTNSIFICYNSTKKDFEYLFGFINEKNKFIFNKYLFKKSNKWDYNESSEFLYKLDNEQGKEDLIDMFYNNVYDECVIINDDKLVSEIKYTLKLLVKN